MSILWSLLLLSRWVWACYPDYEYDVQWKARKGDLVFVGTCAIKMPSIRLDNPKMSDLSVTYYDAKFTVEHVLKPARWPVEMLGSRNTSVLIRVGYFGPRNSDYCMNEVSLGVKYLLFVNTSFAIADDSNSLAGSNSQMPTNHMFSVTNSPEELMRDRVNILRAARKAINNAVPPKFEKVRQRKLYLWNGSALHLACRLKDGLPAPRYTWQFRQFDISTYGIATKKLTELSVDSATLEHSGNYTCIADNEIGKDSVTFEVHVMASPNAIDNSTVYVPCPPEQQSYCLHGGLCLYAPVIANPRDGAHCLCVRQRFGPRCQFEERDSQRIYAEEWQRNYDRLATIIGITAGVLVLLLVFAVSFCQARKHRQRRRQSTPPQPNCHVDASVIANKRANGRQQSYELDERQFLLANRTTPSVTPKTGYGHNVSPLMVNNVRQTVPMEVPANNNGEVDSSLTFQNQMATAMRNSPYSERFSHDSETTVVERQSAASNTNITAGDPAAVHLKTRAQSLTEHDDSKSASNIRQKNDRQDGNSANLAFSSMTLSGPSNIVDDSCHLQKHRRLSGSTVPTSNDSDMARLPSNESNNSAVDSNQFLALAANSLAETTTCVLPDCSIEKADDGLIVIPQNEACRPRGSSLSDGNNAVSPTFQQQLPIENGLINAKDLDEDGNSSGGSSNGLDQIKKHIDAISVASQRECETRERERFPTISSVSTSLPVSSSVSAATTYDYSSPSLLWSTPAKANCVIRPPMPRRPRYPAPRPKPSASENEALLKFDITKRSNADSLQTSGSPDTGRNDHDFIHETASASAYTDFYGVPQFCTYTPTTMSCIDQRKTPQLRAPPFHSTIPQRTGYPGASNATATIVYTNPAIDSATIPRVRTSGRPPFRLPTNGHMLL